MESVYIAWLVSLWLTLLATEHLVVTIDILNWDRVIIIRVNGLTISNFEMSLGSPTQYFVLSKSGGSDYAVMSCDVTVKVGDCCVLLVVTQSVLIVSLVMFRSLINYTTFSQSDFLNPVTWPKTHVYVLHPIFPCLECAEVLYLANQIAQNCHNYYEGHTKFANPRSPVTWTH